MIVDTGNGYLIEKSYLFGQTVNVREHIGYCKPDFGKCARCGHPLRRRWWSVYAMDGGEICRLGKECVTKLT